MTSTIDPTKPTSTHAYTADVRDNFAAAKAEIEALQAPADTYLNVYATAAQQFAAGETKDIIYDGVISNPHSAYNTSTGEYQPTIPGIYLLVWTFGWQAVTVGTYVIKLNGSPLVNVLTSYLAPQAVYNKQIQALVQLNGTTDILTFTVHALTSDVRNAAVGAANNCLTAVLIAPQ